MFYRISNSYVNYLHSHDSEVLLNHEKDGTVLRPYIGILIKKSNFNYFIPLSHPNQKTDYELDGNLKESTMTIIRLIKETDFLGKLRINNMIPVPSSELSKINLDLSSSAEKKDYINLMIDQAKVIKTRMSEIISKSNIVYNYKNNEQNFNYWKQKSKPNYLNSTVDFKQAESYCSLWEKNISKSSLESITSIKNLNDHIRHRDNGYNPTMLEGKHFIFNKDLYRIDQIELKPLGIDSAILTKLTVSGEERYLDKNFTSDSKFNLHLQKIDSKILSNFKDNKGK